MRRFGRAAVMAAVAATALVAAVPALGQGVSLSFVGRAAGGGMSSSGGASEISAYSPGTKRLFVTNGATNKIDIWNVANPASPSRIASVTLPNATGVQSVATNGTLVAAATTVGADSTEGKFEPGRIFIFDTSGTLDPRAPSGVAVGMLPDSVHFTPDGKTIVVANEGEPRNYCQTGGQFVAANDPQGTVSVIDATAATLRASSIDFTAYDASAAAIRTAGGRVYGPGATVAQDLEPEYVAISADSKTAFVTLQENNAVAEVNLETRAVVRVMGLGYKDHSVAGSGLDPSDREVSSSQGAIAINTWPVFGMYQPDNIATYTGVDGTRYFVTANEGDAREYPCLLGGTSTSASQAEDGRIKDLKLDATAFPDRAAQETDAQLGRLTVTRFAPTASLPTTWTATESSQPTQSPYGGQSIAAAASSVTGRGLTAAYVLGARSMTIWRAPAGTGVGTAVRVADTGDLMEQRAAALLPSYFNSDGNSSTGGFNSMDTRSDNKGPEPEGIAIGNAFGMTLAFVGLERQNGVMVFNISDPTKPTFLNYLNTTNYTATSGANYATNTNAGDVSPEGILFVRASDSPTGKPALFVSYELSGTTAIYNVDGTAVKPDAPTGVTARTDGRSAIVSWTAPREDGGGALLGYNVVSRPGGYTCTADTTTSCRIPSLPLNRKYTFTVTARNLAGSSPASAASAELTTNSFRPSGVSDVTLRAGASSIRASWRRSADTGGLKIDRYIATAVPGGRRCETTGRSCTIEGLTPGRRYGVRVVAVNAVGQSVPVRADRVLVGFTQGATTIARESPLAVRWLVRTHSTGKVVGRIVSGECTINGGRITATGPVGSRCVIKVTVGASASHASVTRILALEIREPRDYTDVFARARRS